MFKDLYDREIKLDDKVLVAFPDGNTATLREGIVLAIREDWRTRYGKQELFISSVRMRWIKGHEGETVMKRVESYRFYLLEP
jgi:hypothetical protein